MRGWPLDMEERLPEEWISITLGEIGEWHGGGTPSKSSMEFWTQGDIPWVSPKDMKVLKIHDTIDHLSNTTIEKTALRLCPAGTILIVVRSGILARTLPIAIAQVPLTMNQDMKGIIPYEGINSAYIMYYLIFSSENILSDYSKYGTTVSSINTESLKNYSIPIVSSAQQNRIVAAIEQQFTRLDSAVDSLQSAKARIKQYRASLLKSAIEGELTKEWRAAHPASETGEQLLERILTERRARWEEEQLAKMREKEIIPKDNKWKQQYKEPQGPDVASLPELPEGWCWATLESIAYIQLGKMLSPKAFEQHLIQLPYLRNENIRWGSIDYGDIKKMGFKEEELEKYTVLSDDLLVCEGGEPGRCAVYKENTEYVSDQQRLMYQKALHRVRMIENIINPHFVQLCLQHYVASQTIIPKFSETTIRHLPLEKISILPFPLPPLIEIEQIIAEIEANLTNIAKLEEATENSLKRAERERQSILCEAFAGRLVPQDPQDGPASVLLERIREERKKREEVGQIRRREQKMAMDQRRGKRKRVAPLYDVLVDAGGELPPEDLYKRSEEQRKEKPEQERDEGFYVELDIEATANLIVEERPAEYKVLLRAVEQDDEHLEEGEVVEEDEIVPAGEPQRAREEEKPRTLWDV